MIPFTHPAQKIPGGQRQLQPGGVQHDQGEGYCQLEIKIRYLYPIPNTYNLVYGA